METWYWIVWKHKDKHKQISREAEQQRLANKALAQKRAAAQAEREAKRSKRGPAPAGAPKPAEQG
ncbi:MAG: hypothetical protein AMJ93_12600 [Anaerolineae bacterium SM23_84]|nr:MAG: hypothetical protein AMJ93_12600 [Anaerolineae bacterium SM23_84]